MPATIIRRKRKVTSKKKNPSKKKITKETQKGGNLNWDDSVDNAIEAVNAAQDAVTKAEAAAADPAAAKDAADAAATAATEVTTVVTDQAVQATAAATAADPAAQAAQAAAAAAAKAAAQAAAQAAKAAADKAAAAATAATADWVPIIIQAKASWAAQAALHVALLVLQQNNSNIETVTNALKVAEIASNINLTETNKTNLQFIAIYQYFSATVITAQTAGIKITSVDVVINALQNTIEAFFNTLDPNKVLVNSLKAVATAATEAATEAAAAAAAAAAATAAPAPAGPAGPAVSVDVEEKFNPIKEAFDNLDLTNVNTTDFIINLNKQGLMVNLNTKLIQFIIDKKNAISAEDNKIINDNDILNELNYSKLINGKLDDNSWPTKEQKESMVKELGGRITAVPTGGTKKKKDKKNDKKNDKKRNRIDKDVRFIFLMICERFFIYIFLYKL
jgi:hypothetical protein